MHTGIIKLYTLPDPNRAVVLATTPTGIPAEKTAAALEAHGWPARTTEALTSGLRVEAPGGVHGLLRQADPEQARSVLRAIEEG